MTRTIRFTLLEAKNPALYAEIEAKITGGMKPGDVVLDMLQELHWRREFVSTPQTGIISEVENQEPVLDFEAAISAMDDL